MDNFWKYFFDDVDSDGMLAVVLTVTAAMMLGGIFLVLVVAGFRTFPEVMIWIIIIFPFLYLPYRIIKTYYKHRLDN